MVKNIVNLNEVVSTATANYIQQNSADFKSTEVGPQGPQGLQGPVGDSVTVTGVTNNVNGSLDITFSDGYVHTTDIIKGDDGVDGNSITIDNIINEPDGRLTIEFSDSTVHTSGVLVGEQGIRGVQGISVHHTKGTNTTDPEGDFSTPGETDTYTFYGDADELINLGHFSIRNGDSAYAYAVEGGFTGTLQEFIDVLGMIDDIVDAANNAVTIAQGHANSAELSSQLAEKWAEEGEDVEVEVGKYSAKHHATKAIAGSVAAAASADAASASASNAANSASNANTSAGNASTSASQAASSASAAANSESNAATSESNASTSATSASTSAGEAAASAASIVGSVTAAATSATSASSSAASASVSAANAATSETNAAIILGSKQDLLISGTNIKTINGEDVLGSGDLTVTAGSGGYAANVFLTALTSTTNGSYKQISYTPDAATTTVSGVVNNGEVLLEAFIFDGDVEVTAIPAGTWDFNMYGSVSSSNQVSQFRFEVFARTTGGAETVLVDHISEEVNSVTTELVSTSFTSDSHIVNVTDRIGIKIYGTTTRTSNTTFEIVVGDGQASYFTTPLELRHNQLRDRDAVDSHPIGAITGLQTALDEINTYTESAAEPSSPKVGDEWLDAVNEILYKRVSDGVTAVWLQTNGGSAITFRSTGRVNRVAAADTTLLDSDLALLVDASVGNVVVTLPTAVGRMKQDYNIIRIDNTGNTVSIVTTGSETIGIDTDAELFAQESLVLMSNNTNWYVR